VHFPLDSWLFDAWPSHCCKLTSTSEFRVDDQLSGKPGNVREFQSVWRVVTLLLLVTATWPCELDVCVFYQVDDKDNADIQLGSARGRQPSRTQHPVKGQIPLHSPYHNSHNASVAGCLLVPHPAEWTQICILCYMNEYLNLWYVQQKPELEDTLLRMHCGNCDKQRDDELFEYLV